MLSTEVSYLGMGEPHADFVFCFSGSLSQKSSCLQEKLCGFSVVVTYFINLNSSIIHIHVESLTV